jgi:hypothetical protein
MRSIPTALNTELLKEASFLAHLVVLSAATPLRYTDLDVDVWSGGNQYMARGFEFDGIEYSLSATVDKMGLRVDNVDQAVSSLVMSEEIRGKGASITLAALTDQAQVIATAQIFSGLIDMIEVDELSGRIDIVTPWMLWRRKLPRRGDLVRPDVRAVHRPLQDQLLRRLPLATGSPGQAALVGHGAEQKSAGKLMNLPKTAAAAKVVARMIEAPYRLGGASPEEGFDCLGYLRYFYASLGYVVPAESDGISATDYLAAYETDPDRCKRALWRALLRFGDRVDTNFRQLADLLVFHTEKPAAENQEPETRNQEPALTSGVWLGRGNVLSCDARIGVAVFPAARIGAQRVEVIRPCLR